MQAFKNDKVVDSKIGSLKEVIKKGEKDLKSGKADRITIASFHEGETIVLRGLKFKISCNNQKAKRLTLKML